MSMLNNLPPAPWSKRAVCAISAPVMVLLGCAAATALVFATIWLWQLWSSSPLHTLDTYIFIVFVFWAVAIYRNRENLRQAYAARKKLKALRAAEPKSRISLGELFSIILQVLALVIAFVAPLILMVFSVVFFSDEIKKTITEPEAIFFGVILFIAVVTLVVAGIWHALDPRQFGKKLPSFFAVYYGVGLFCLGALMNLPFYAAVVMAIVVPFAVLGWLYTCGDNTFFSLFRKREE